LSALLNLTPQLIELDNSVPLLADILHLIDCEGEVALVPMLQALYMYNMDDVIVTTISHLIFLLLITSFADTLYVSLFVIVYMYA
jgi:hypothetical protein